MTHRVYAWLSILSLVMISPALAASLSELAVTMQDTGQAAGGAARGAATPPRPAAPPAAAPAAPVDADAPAQTEDDDIGDAAPRKKAEKKRTFDNSHTDIGLFNQTIYEKDRVKSVMYTPEEVKDIYLAVNTYLKSVGRGGDLSFDEEAFLSRLGGLVKRGNTTTQSNFFTYPQFFLDSFVYYSPKDWIVWINGEKITPETPKESNNIHVTGIDSDKVSITWFPLSMERVMEIWRKYPHDNVTVDAEHGQVIFSLKANQTFSSYVMRVLEGRVMPVTVDISSLEAASQKERLNTIGRTPPKADAPAAAGGEKENHEGLPGLINSYKHMPRGDIP